jgi:hypothetical protein
MWYTLNPFPTLLPSHSIFVKIQTTVFLFLIRSSSTYRCTGLHRALHLARSFAQFLPWVISIPLFFSTSFILSPHVCLGLPLACFPYCLACHAIFRYLLLFMSHTWPNRLNCDSSIVDCSSIAPKPSLIVWFLTLSLCVFSTILLRYPISRDWIWLMCLVVNNFLTVPCVF